MHAGAAAGACFSPAWGRADNYRADPELQTGEHAVIAVRRIACRLRLQRLQGCAAAADCYTLHAAHDTCERFGMMARRGGKSVASQQTITW